MAVLYAAIASSSRAGLLSRSPSRSSALPRPFCVTAQSSGTRSRVCSASASRYAATASSSRAVPFSRSPTNRSALPIRACDWAHCNGTDRGTVFQKVASKLAIASCIFAVSFLRSRQACKDGAKLDCAIAHRSGARSRGDPSRASR